MLHRASRISGRETPAFQRAIDPACTANNDGNNGALPTHPRAPAPGAELIAVLTHELRSPLAALQYAVRILDRDEIAASIRKQTVAAMERQFEQIMRLIDDVADGNRLDLGQLTLVLRRIDARGVVRHALETMEPQLRARRHRVMATLPRDPVWISGDTGRLEQVMVNILGNAARYTDPGGTIELKVSEHTGRARIAVRDSGIGIPRENLESIFEMFRQGNRTDPRSHPGLGLGLALSRRLIELHRGTLSASSAGVGHGSEFTVILPLAQR